MDELLTTLDAAKLLARSVERVRDLEREGKLQAQRTRSGQRLFRFEDVERLAKRLVKTKYKYAPAVRTRQIGASKW